MVWDSSVVMTKYMEHNLSAFNVTSCSDKLVLELGCGCGLTGMAFMMKGAKVVMTDLDCVIEALTIPNANVGVELKCVIF